MTSTGQPSFVMLATSSLVVVDFWSQDDLILQTLMRALVRLLSLFLTVLRCRGFFVASVSRNMGTGGQRTVPAAVPKEGSHHPQPTVKGILFDMDGTLTDSDTLHYEAYRDTLLRLAPEFNGGKPLDRYFYDHSLSGASNEVIVPKILPHLDREEQENLWKSKEALYRERSVSTKPLEGVLKLMDWCDEVGVKMIVVTNAPRLDAEHTMSVLKLRDRVLDVVIGEECTRPKPFPDPYEEGLRRLGLEAEDCIAFEDSFSGLASATAAGLRTVAILTTRSEMEMRERGAFLSVNNFEAEELWSFLTTPRVG